MSNTPKMVKIESLEETFEDKSILITGGTGSVGSGLVKRLLDFNPKVIRIFGIDEDAQFNLQQDLKEHGNLRFLIGDVRDKERLVRALENIDIVFHAAALKHVPLCEYNPFEAVKTNVIGTQNLLDIAISENVGKVITISTDKAVNPANVMGATKLLSERLTIAANYHKGSKRTVFSSVRFGNIFGSRGSVVRVFEKQIQSGGPVTITHPDMTRFVVSIEGAIELVLRATQMARGGELFILKMPATNIKDLAEVMIEKLAPKYGHDPDKIEIKIIGKRKAEKMYEELLTEDEAQSSLETEDMEIVLPESNGNRNHDTSSRLTRRYASLDAKRLTKQEIGELLLRTSFDT